MNFIKFFIKFCYFNCRTNVCMNKSVEFLSGKEGKIRKFNQFEVRMRVVIFAGKYNSCSGSPFPSTPNCYELQ